MSIPFIHASTGREITEREMTLRFEYMQAPESMAPDERREAYETELADLDAELAEAERRLAIVKAARDDFKANAPR